GQELRALALIAHDLARQKRPRIQPRGRQTDTIQIRSAELRRRELAGREHSSVHARADLADQPHARDRVLELLEELVEHAAVDAEIAGEIEMLPLELLELLVDRAALLCGIEQIDQRVRHAGERR